MVLETELCERLGMRILLTLLFIGFVTQAHAGDLPPIEVAQDLKDGYTVAASSFAGPGSGIFVLLFAVVIIAQLE